MLGTRPLQLYDIDDLTTYVLVVENPTGNIVGCYEYDDEEVARAAFRACIGAKICLYKQDCKTTLIECQES